MKHTAMSNSINSMNSTVFDYTKSILPVLWKFLDTRKRPCFISMNVYALNNEWVISIIKNNKIRRFRSKDNENLVKKVSFYLKVN